MRMRMRTGTMAMARTGARDAPASRSRYILSFLCTFFSVLNYHWLYLQLDYNDNDSEHLDNDPQRARSTGHDYHAMQPTLTTTSHQHEDDNESRRCPTNSNEGQCRTTKQQQVTPDRRVSSQWYASFLLFSFFATNIYYIQVIR